MWRKFYFIFSCVLWLKFLWWSRDIMWLYTSFGLTLATTSIPSLIETLFSKYVTTYERGYFGSISSGREFQFFSAHFISESSTDTGAGAFDRYTLLTYGKTIEKSCNFSKTFFFSKHQSWHLLQEGIEIREESRE